jgi:hypothetical protein
MRTFSRALVVAVALFSFGMLSSSASANTLLSGTFKLNRPAQWTGATLPAGAYQFKLTTGQTDANTLVISGGKQSLSMLVYAHNACESCKTVTLKMTVQGDSRVVTSMDLPGYHLDFKKPRMENAQDAAADTSSWVEQISAQVDPAK